MKPSARLQSKAFRRMTLFRCRVTWARLMFAPRAWTSQASILLRPLGKNRSSRDRFPLKPTGENNICIHIYVYIYIYIFLSTWKQGWDNPSVQTVQPTATSSSPSVPQSVRTAASISNKTSKLGFNQSGLDLHVSPCTAQRPQHSVLPRLLAF